MKRNPRKVRWTKAFRKAAGKEMELDSTFEFERKRNRPERYDRERMQKTIAAMRVIAAAKQRRIDRINLERTKQKRKVEKERDKLELKQNIDLIISPVVRETAQVHTVETPMVIEKTKNANVASSSHSTK